MTIPIPEVLALAERWIPYPTTLYPHGDYLKDLRAKFISEIEDLMQPRTQDDDSLAIAYMKGVQDGRDKKRAQSGGEVEDAMETIGELCGEHGFDHHHEALETLRAALTGGWNFDMSQAPVETSLIISHPLGGVCEGVCISGFWYVLDGTNLTQMVNGMNAIQRTHYLTDPTAWRHFPTPPADGEKA